MPFDPAGGIRVFLTWYNISPLEMLDLVNWIRNCVNRSNKTYTRLTEIAD